MREAAMLRPRTVQGFAGRGNLAATPDLERPQVKADTPPVILAAVSVALVRDGRVLLVRRGREPGRGIWAFPGGRVEPGESREAAARRELAEETALSAGALAPYRTVAILPAGPGAPGFDLTVFAGDAAEGALAAGDDAEAAGWFAEGELDGIPVIDSVLEIARELLTAAATPAG